VSLRLRLILATVAIWLVVAVAVTIPGVRHYTGLPGCEGYECEWRFQLLVWFVRPVFLMMVFSLVVALLVEYWLTERRR
jgi:hypothetical protein